MQDCGKSLMVDISYMTTTITTPQPKQCVLFELNAQNKGDEEDSPRRYERLAHL